MMYRLDTVPGEWIDRSSSIPFTFEGRLHEGLRGDTITSALCAAGVMILGRSFKYHRPRGVLSFANHDVNALFQVGALPNVRGDVTPLAAEMQIAAVNTFGGVLHDRARVLDRLARFLPVGFYYKAFNSKRWFPRWERLIRNASGLGRIDFDAPHVQTPKRYAFCDVLVIGGGLTGMRAALTAAESGAQVMLIEEHARLGGMARWAPASLASDTESVDSLAGRVRANSRVEVICSAFAAGCYADGWVAVIETHRMAKVRAKAVVIATGAIQLPAVFRHNDLPGVLLTSAAQRLLHRHAVAPGRSVVLMGADQAAYAAAIDLSTHGVRITHLLDSSISAPQGPLVEATKSRGIEVVHDATVVEARSDHAGCLSRIEYLVRSRSETRRHALACDALLMSGGWAPANQLLLQAGGKVAFDDSLQMHVPTAMPPGIFIAGRANGVWSPAAKLDDGDRAGFEAAAHAGLNLQSRPARSVAREPVHLAKIERHPQGKDFVDFDEDLQVKDLSHAAQEGFDSIELLKRYTTVGMGPSQGKHSNVHAARILSAARGVPMSVVGLTTARPMYHPVPMKHLAGRGFSPVRATPIEKRHEELSAVWMLAGNWRRPEYYRKSESRAECIEAEVRAVRTGVGLIDVSTLGKIEIHGPDAGEFLDRAYAGRYSDLKIGMTRYALFLDEAGIIVDDGVIARLSDHCFYFTTTTGGSATVYRELLRLNALWGLNCALVNVTGHRAAFNLAGPRSREVLSRLTSLDLSESRFPFLGAREADVAGVRARLLRVGFVGELGYEIHVPFSSALSVWDALSDAGRSAGLSPFGVEAQRILRLEKGHLIVGQDTDGLTNPFEAQAAWAVKMQKPFFVGQRSLRILERRGPSQLLVGFEFSGRIAALKECHLVIDGDSIAGRVTSVAYSHTLQKTIGLAMVKPSLAGIGTQLRIRLSDGSMTGAVVSPTPFYDRDNQRQKMQEAA